MKCPECGADLSGDDKFCNNCGAALPASSSASDPEPPASLPAEPAPVDDAPDQAQELADHEMFESTDLPGETEPALEEVEPMPSTPERVEPFLAADPAPGEELAPASAAPPVTKAKGKRNTGLIIAIVVLVILLLCCCCAIGVIAANFEEISLILEEMMEATY
jgi:hypothetical protein